MPLPMAQNGMEQVIRSITGSDKVKNHLNSLGFCAGARVTLISKCQGNVILKVQDSRIALSEKLACRIHVA